MQETLLAEDSSNYKLVPRVYRVSKSLKNETNHHKCLVALLDLLLHEAGYYASQSVNDPTPISPIWQSDNVEEMPSYYELNEYGAFQIIYRIFTLTDAVCKFVAVPTGDVLLANLIPICIDTKCRSVALHTLKYVNCNSREIDGRFINIKELSHRIKDELATPIRCEYLSEAQRINPSLAGLPEELIIYIAKFLRRKDRVRLSLCSKQFLSLCSF